MGEAVQLHSVKGQVRAEEWAVREHAQADMHLHTDGGDPKTWEGPANQSWPAMRRLAERIGPEYRD